MGWNRTGSLINRYKITEELLSGAFRIPCEFNFQILNYESRYQYFVSGNSRCDGIYLFFSRRVYFLYGDDGARQVAGPVVFFWELLVWLCLRLLQLLSGN